MTNKDRIILTEAQLEALKLTKAWEHQASIVGYVAKGQHIPNSQYQPLSKLTLEQLLRVFYEPNSYELGPVFAKGDWATRTQGHSVDPKAGRLGYVFQIKTLKSTELMTDGEGNIHNVESLRHSTPEEIKNEKERQMWAKIGREVGEFKLGDVVIMNTGEPITVSYLEGAKRHYKDSFGSRKGFFPVESFINYEEEMK